MAAYSELYIEQYSDFTTTINIDDIQGNAINLSGYSVSSQFRKSPYTASYFSFDAQVTDASIGEITLNMPAANTADIMPGRYLYDVVITSGDNAKTRVVEGIVNVIAGITK